MTTKIVSKTKKKKEKKNLQKTYKKLFPVKLFTVIESKIQFKYQKLLTNRWHYVITQPQVECEQNIEEKNKNSWKRNNYLFHP